MRTSLPRRASLEGAGAFETLAVVSLVALVAGAGLLSFGQGANRVIAGARDAEAPRVGQRSLAAGAGSVAGAAAKLSRAARELAQVGAKLDGFKDIADVAHYAPVPRHLDSPYFNHDVLRGLRVRPASGNNAPGFAVASEVASRLQQGFDADAIARAAGDDPAVRVLADVLQDIRQTYGVGEFDAHTFEPRGYWDWNELDHVLHYVAEPLEPYANWAGPGRSGWLRGSSAGVFAVREGEALTPLQVRLQTFRKLFETRGVSDDVRRAVFPEADEADYRQIRALKNQQKRLRAEVEAEDLQRLASATSFLSSDVVETLKRLMGGTSKEAQAQRELLFSALVGDVELAKLEPSQIAARVRARRSELP